MSTAEQKKFFTAEEYLERERFVEVRSEFYEGELFAMAGGSHRHNLIQSNCHFALRLRLQGKGCFVYVDNMKLHIPIENAFVYPDVQVMCDNPDFFEGREDVITNSTVIFEVLSESTETFDRGAKFEKYKKNSAIQEYILVAQKEPLINVYRKSASGEWPNFNERYYGLETELSIESLGLTIPLKEIYEAVQFTIRKA